MKERKSGLYNIICKSSMRHQFGDSGEPGSNKQQITSVVCFPGRKLVAGLAETVKVINLETLFGYRKIKEVETIIDPR